MKAMELIAAIERTIKLISNAITVREGAGAIAIKYMETIKLFAIW